ncbi:Plasminogen [Mizuhopecten yessoensis]|uniref:Plasminogen n=1 Tax=Mizuhopecten yessoensis TaxID=6573 RepID=A0A210Q6P7_MIZYE|nr:Plasminogen [Mizuhopecten yessoensis]
MARYRCTSFNGQPVFDSCPVVKCDGLRASTTTPTSCSVKDVFNSSLSRYEGGVTCTKGGVTCQRWDSNYPHAVLFFSGRSDLGNRCQFEGELHPWCYTTDPALRWDYCPVEEKGCEDPPPMLTPSTNTAVETNIVWPYHASISFAWYRCTSLRADEPVTSCPVTRCDRDLKWLEATVSCSGKSCFIVLLSDFFIKMQHDYSILQQNCDKPKRVASPPSIKFQ